VDAVISNIRICIMRLSFLGIRIHTVIAVIKCGYYPLFAYAVMATLDYYPNIYIYIYIYICKLK
jgi:hypothetical protein